MTGRFAMVPLGEVLAKSEEWITLEPDDRYREVTVRLWGKGVVQRREVAGAEIAARRRLVVHPQQFILSRIDARNGALGLVPNSLDGAVVSNDFPVFSPNPLRLLPSFLGWMSKTRAFIDLCKAASEGTTNRVRLVEDRFLATEIPLPPVEEQRQIVTRIDELAAKIEEARGLRQEAVEGAELLWKSRAREMFASLAEARVEPLRKFVIVRGGGTPSKSNPFFWDGPIPWIAPKDMKSREIWGGINHISEPATVDSPAKLIDPGSVLIVVRGMILTHTVPSALLRVPATINQDMKALVPDKSVIPEYLCSALWALNHLLLELVEKSTHDTRKLETPKLLNFEIPLPTVSEQRQIVAYLDDLQAKADVLKRLQAETAAELDALLPSILDKAFKGEL